MGGASVVAIASAYQLDGGKSIQSVGSDPLKGDSLQLSSTSITNTSITLTSSSDENVDVEAKLDDGLKPLHGYPVESRRSQLNDGQKRTLLELESSVKDETWKKAVAKAKSDKENMNLPAMGSKERRSVLVGSKET